MKILLFDLDGVLLEPHAYHQALRQTVALLGRAMGYRQVTLTQEDIEVFESAGVSSEWDSSAICTALLLRGIWTISPDFMLPPAPPLPKLPPHNLPAPDFQDFFRSEQMAPMGGTLPTQLAERSLLSDAYAYTGAQAAALRAILRGARQVHGSLTHVLFQELVLGSRAFKDAYGTEPHLDSPGYLLTRDRPTLPLEAREWLLAWLGQPDHYAAVFTNRPSRPPLGIFGTPEAELGLAAAELPQLPLAGRGGLAWMAKQRGLAPEALLKPAAAHALAALRRAAGDPLKAALRAAASLALDQHGDPGWERLAGAEIYIFEDSAKGLHSILAAQECLARFGVPVQAILVGVTQGPHKRRSLEAAGAQVFRNLSEALQRSRAIA